MRTTIEPSVKFDDQGTSMFAVSTAPTFSAPKSVPVLNIQAGPTPLLSLSPPAMAVPPSADRLTEYPSNEGSTPSNATTLPPCCVQTLPLRVKAQMAPLALLSVNPPTTALLPSAESACATPNCGVPTPSEGTSLLPCWLQTPPLRVKAQAAPSLLLSVVPPMRAVLPSAERATEYPCSADPVAPVPTSLPPCCVHTPPRSG